MSDSRPAEVTILGHTVLRKRRSTREIRSSIKNDGGNQSAV